MPTTNKLPRYQAYLLRFWEESRPNDNLPALVRFSLEDPHTGRRQGFATLEEMVTFLRQEITLEDDKPEGDQPLPKN